MAIFQRDKKYETPIAALADNIINHVPITRITRSDNKPPEELSSEQINIPAPSITQTPNPPKQIIDNPDGTITISQEGANPQTMTKEEYRKLAQTQGQEAGVNEFNRNYSASSEEIAAARHKKYESLFSQISEEAPTNVAPMQTPSETGGAVLTVIGGAAAGAAAGLIAAPLTMGLSVPVGAALGATSALIRKMGVATKHTTGTATAQFTGSIKNMGTITTAAHNGLDPATAVALWNKEDQDIAAAESRLKEMSSNSVENFLGSPGNELKKINEFKELRGIYRNQLIEAISNPQKGKVVDYSIPLSATPTE